MASLNRRVVSTAPRTAEGAVASRINPVQQTRRLVLACLLWEDNFYCDGKTSAQLIAETVPRVDPEVVAHTALEARTEQELRHVPLFLVRELLRHPKIAKFPGLVRATLANVIQRPDELTEFLSIYWKDGKTPLAPSAKKGLADAFLKFDRYALSKYNRDGNVKLRDVLFLTHPKPQTSEQAQLFKDLANKTLGSADTWEVALSDGFGKKSVAEKRALWMSLLEENKLGALALIRNLRNFTETGVPDSLIRDGLKKIKTERVLPFRFIAAARYAPRFEPELETAMFKCLEGAEKLPGKTVLVVDNSGSMASPVSSKSDLRRVDAAAALAMLLREVCEDIQIVVFGGTAGLIPPRKGFALRDAIARSGHGGSTNTGLALNLANREGYDRCIVITDEQSQTQIPSPIEGSKAYFINVANNQNGIGYGKFLHIDGWSEAVVGFIQAVEAHQE